MFIRSTHHARISVIFIFINLTADDAIDRFITTI